MTVDVEESEAKMSTTVLFGTARERGAALVEYGLLVAMITVAVLAVVHVTGQDASSTFASVAAAI